MTEPPPPPPPPLEQPTDSEQAWYASLPTVYTAAAAVFTDPAGHVLLVKPNYRDHWSLPGGIIEHGEPPHVGCAREVAEELGLDIEPGPLLAIGWTPPSDGRPRAIVHWLFDGGTLDPDREITLQEEELDDYRYVAVTELAAYLPPLIADRLTAALRARTSGATAYVPAGILQGAPPPGPPAPSCGCSPLQTHPAGRPLRDLRSRATRSSLTLAAGAYCTREPSPEPAGQDR